MSERKELTIAELLNAPLDSLNTDQIMRRSAVISMQKNEREMELANHQNDEFQTKKQERIRMREVAIQNAKFERDKIEQEQENCAHMTGGRDLQGWLRGDGSLYGSSTAALQLPTGEIYYLCFRCQKEWRIPSKRKVINGEMTLEEYQARVAEYNKVANWPRKSFDPYNGEICAASRFNIPALELQRSQDNADFNLFLEKRKLANA